MRLPEPMTCFLCGEEGPGVHKRTVAWKDPGDKPFEDIPRCDRTADCYRRVVESGNPWIARLPLGIQP